MYGLREIYGLREGGRLPCDRRRPRSRLGSLPRNAADEDGLVTASRGFSAWRPLNCLPFLFLHSTHPAPSPVPLPANRSSFFSTASNLSSKVGLVGFPWRSVNALPTIRVRISIGYVSSLLRLATDWAGVLTFLLGDQLLGEFIKGYAANLWHCHLSFHCPL